MSISTATPIRLLLVSALVILSTVTACANGDGSKRASASSDDRTYQVAELQAALPTTAELAEQYPTVTTCFPEDQRTNECDPNPTAARMQGATETGEDLGSTIWIKVTASPDAKAAQLLLENLRTEESEYLDLVSKSATGDQPSGPDDTDLDDWQGFRGTGALNFTGSDGRSDESVEYGSLALRSGNAVVQLKVHLADGSASKVRKAAELWARHIIEKV